MRLRVEDCLNDTAGRPTSTRIPNGNEVETEVRYQAQHRLRGSQARDRKGEEKLKNKPSFTQDSQWINC
jgi:hypothetical protein